MLKTLRKIRSANYRMAKFLGDFNAIASGSPKKITKRFLRKKSGRFLGKTLKKLF